MHFPMVVNWWEKKECGHDAKEGADMDSVHSAVPLKSVGLNLLMVGLVVLTLLKMWGYFACTFLKEEENNI